ncbi:MAG: hypothetical protein ABSE54_10285 [Smithella sp.]
MNCSKWKGKLICNTQIVYQIKCLFCNNETSIYRNKSGTEFEAGKTHYTCKVCGTIQITEEAYDDFNGERFSNSDKSILRIVLRNEHEMRNKIPPSNPLTIEDLRRIIDQYKPLDPLAKMDNALLNINRKSKYAGEKISVYPLNEYPYYHCSSREELDFILKLLEQENFINTDQSNRHLNSYDLDLTVKGYQRLNEIAKPGKNSKKCFVAMWFADEMKDVYEKAIKPAIEFKEKEDSAPRFEAVKINNIEHINDINDEIIAQIRRSRFMVCDLTGYRGGIYFEAGFAYGLGLDVIYTCRKDWCKEHTLKDKNENEVKILFDENKR